MNPERWRQIEQIYNSVLERRPQDLETFLHQACAGDENLRKEVETLLACDGRAEHFIEQPAMEVAAQVMAKDQGDANFESLIGRSVAHYRIIEKIGEGGMGIVYRAEDSRLNRQVAVKVLPELFSGDPGRLARFEREARLLASLNHPSIAAIYGFDQAESEHFLVMELVEGETLAQKISRGPLPMDEALAVCRQIAEGLEAAHEKGIIHRDLKPANIKITPEGKVKILDFGLAKALQEESANPDRTHSPSLAAQMTHSGIILGTVAYMSPEQANGKVVDKRADIWAFGCILFECLTGKRPFPGETVSETLVAILKEDPDWQLLPAATSWKLKDLLHRCLRKDLNERLHDIADGRIEIGESATADAGSMETAPGPRTFSLLWLAACAVVVLLAGILIGPALMRYLRPSSPALVVTSTIRVEPGHWLDGMRAATGMQRPTRTAMAISSDARFVVYSAIEESPGPQAKPQLYLRGMGQPQAKPISGTEGGISPFLSPGDRYVGFWADGKLKKIPVEGGVATALCDAPLIFGASWGSDNSIVFADAYAAGLSTVSAEGGKPGLLTKPDPKREEQSHRLPCWLPDGRAVLFTVMRHGNDRQPWLALLRLDSREWQVLLQDAADARYVPTGHLVFLRQGTLMAVRFNLAKLEVVGQPVALVENVMQAFITGNIRYKTGAGQFGISDTGSLIYAAGGILPDARDSLVWVDRRGMEQPVTALQSPFETLRLSPDAQKIAYGISGRDLQVWVYDLGRGTHGRLTGEGGSVIPTWTHDSKRLLFSWHKSLAMNLFWQPADGSSPMERLTSSEYGQWPGSLTSDGATLAFVESHPNTSRDILLLHLQSRRVTPFLNSRSDECYPMFSPDGRWLAYSSDESGRFEVNVCSFPNTGGRWKVSLEGGTEPLWERNGKRLFYRWQDQVWAVDFRTDAGFMPGKPRLLFERAGYKLSHPTRSWDISADGQRFLMVRLEERKPQPVTEMILVQNWFEELKRLCPTK